jgi:hypothetical protein
VAKPSFSVTSMCTAPQWQVPRMASFSLLGYVFGITPAMSSICEGVDPLGLPPVQAGRRVVDVIRQGDDAWGAWVHCPAAGAPSPVVFIADAAATAALRINSARSGMFGATVVD